MRRQNRKKEGDLRKELLKGNFIGTPTMVFRCECFKTCGVFREDLPRLQDWELPLRISRSFRFKYIGEALLNSYCVSESISTESEALAEATEIILREHHVDFPKDRRLLSRHYLWLGIRLVTNNKVRKGRAYLIKAARVNPLNVKALAAILLSLFGGNAFSKVRGIFRRARD